MKKISLKRKLYLTLALLCMVILCSWVVFYVRTSQEMLRTSQSYIAQVSDRVIDTMEDTLLGLEHVAVALSTSEDTKKLLLEEHPLLYHEKAGAVRQVLDLIYQPDGLVDEILIYDKDGVYIRLRGSLGNTAASRIHYLVNANEGVQHIVVSLEGYSYIGYITGIFENDRQLGYLVFLMRSSRLQELFMGYDESKSLSIGLVADNTIVAANDSEQLHASVGRLKQQNRTMSIRQVGLTPFRVLVSDSGEAIGRTLQSFFFAATITILLLFAMLLFFYRFLHKLFFSPMLGLMENARQIGAGVGKDKLRLTGQEEFDQLVEQINSMISRLEENSRTLFEMQYKMQNAELEKQRAIIVSLKKQINAHFTVNTLNVIKRLNEIGENEKAGEMCNGLSSLLRYANGAGEFIGGLEEIRVLEQYVDIMLIRYPGRFTATFDVEDELDDVMLPRMLVQPIIENAIIHGLLPLQYGKLFVSAKIKGELLIFKVQNDGRKIPNEVLAALREKISTAPSHPWNESGLEHIALPNIQKRVVSVFGDVYGLTVESTAEQGTTVTLTLPAYHDSNISS